MTQLGINSEVAWATGETLAEIRHLCFGIVDPLEVDFDPEPRPQVYNWDTRGPTDWSGLESLQKLPVRVNPGSQARRTLHS